MEVKRTIIGLICFLGTAVCAANGFAQKGEEPASKPTAPSMNEETVIVTLDHANASDVIEGISLLRYPLRTAAIGDTKIILRGTADIIRQIQMEVIAEIDKPESGDWETHVFPLDQRPSNDFVQLMRAATTSRSTRIAFDGDNRLVVVGGPPADIDAIRQVIASASEQRISLTVRLYFIQGNIGTGNGGEDRLPKSLAGVGCALRGNGFSDLSLLAPVILTVEEGQQFKHSSLLHGSSNTHAQHELKVVVEGMAQASKDGETVQVAIAANAYGEYDMPGEDAVGQTAFETESTIAARLDEYVVLAASPASTADSTALALAISVSRN